MGRKSAGQESARMEPGVPTDSSPYRPLNCRFAVLSGLGECESVALTGTVALTVALTLMVTMTLTLMLALCDPVTRADARRN